MNNDQYLEMVKALAADGLSVEQYDIFEEDLYIVWFNFTLGNYKALLSTDVEDGLYIEVTHNVVKEESYVDIYKKLTNVKINHVENK